MEYSPNSASDASTARERRPMPRISMSENSPVAAACTLCLMRHTTARSPEGVKRVRSTRSRTNYVGALGAGSVQYGREQPAADTSQSTPSHVLMRTVGRRAAAWPRESNRKSRCRGISQGYTPTPYKPHAPRFCVSDRIQYRIWEAVLNRRLLQR
jgi:hypothetical protein